MARWRGAGLARENVQPVETTRVANHHSPRRQGDEGTMQRRTDGDGAMMDRRIAVLPDELERVLEGLGPRISGCIQVLAVC